MEPSPPIDASTAGANAPDATLLPPSFELLKAHTDWRRTWTHIVSGKFSHSAFSDLLFYEQSQGYAEFYQTDGVGGITPLQTHSDWRDSWTLIVPGAFGQSGFTGLLLYDQQAGFAAVYDTNGHGNLIKLHEYGIWRTSWTHIVVVRIPRNTPDCNGWAVVLYDQSAGHLEIHASNGSGLPTPLNSYDGLRTTWTQVIGGDFSSGAQLLFYEGSTGRGELYQIDDQGNANFSSGQDGLPEATDIIPGNYGWYGTSLLFYYRPSGRGTFVDFNGPQVGDGPTGFVLEGAETYDDWRSSWTLVVPGDFWASDPEDVKFQNRFTDLLFYEAENVYGEFYLHEPFNSIQAEPLSAYASADSVAQGGSIQFHINSRIGPYTIDVYRQDANEVFVTRITALPEFPRPYEIARTGWRDGPQRPASATLTIGQDWRSGLYLARVAQRSLETQPTSIGATARRGEARTTLTRIGPVGTAASVDIPFVVRAARRGSQARILFCIATTTYQAYNFWGGRSLYGFRARGYRVWSAGSTFTSPNLEQFPRAFRVSFRRPHDPLHDPEFPGPTAPGEPDQHVQKACQFWEVPLIRWLARLGIAAEFCTAVDLHENSELLKNYRLLVSVGHDEYWSKEMRDYVEAFTTAGGNVAFFSGNVCWWQVRFESNSDTMVCYKDGTFDPENPRHPDRVTVNWYDEPVQRPETSMTGVSYLGTPAPYPGWVLCQQYVVQDAEHWVLAGTGLKTDDFFGAFANATRTVVGTETDRYQDKDPHSPRPFEKVACVFWKGREAATMGVFKRGGTVFTAATMNWTLGLSQDATWSELDQITRNVFERLG
jgi:hypothetical protein